MLRAGVVGVASIVAAVACQQLAYGSTSCQDSPQGQLCTSQVDFNQFSQTAYMSQLQSEWCWAASISMIFSFYQHPVSQMRIVTDVYGAPENIPAMAGIVIADELNRCWADDQGNAFDSQLTGAYDAMAGVYDLSNQQIIAELDQNRPMVIGARTHAMVVTMIQYYQTPAGPNVQAVGVFDPWPGIGARLLAQDEATPANLGGSLFFAATVRVSPHAGACPAQPPPPNGETGGGCGQNNVSGTTGNWAAVAGAVLLVVQRRTRLRRAATNSLLR